MGGVCFNRVRHDPYPKGMGGFHYPNLFGTAYMRPHPHAATKRCTVIKLDERKTFTETTTPPALANFVTQMLTPALFAIANLLVWILSRVAAKTLYVFITHGDLSTTF